MQSMTRRSALGAVGLAVAAMIGIVLPLAYATFGYLERSEVLAFKAKLSAAKVAKYIYGREKLWQYQSVRLDEVLDVPSDAGASPLRQRVSTVPARSFSTMAANWCSGSCAARSPSSSAPPPLVG
jgi:ABC-type phosphate transport system auxiliary subunit